MRTLRQWRVQVVCVAALAVLTGCGPSQRHHAESSAASPSPDLTSTISTSNRADGIQCPAQEGRQITITNGDFRCAEAYAIAAKYDPQGEKYQDIDAFECGTGTADVRPLEFQCTSEDVEFAVYGN